MKFNHPLKSFPKDVQINLLRQQVVLEMTENFQRYSTNYRTPYFKYNFNFKKDEYF